MIELPQPVGSMVLNLNLGGFPGTAHMIADTHLRQLEVSSDCTLCLSADIAPIDFCGQRGPLGGGFSPIRGHRINLMGISLRLFCRTGVPLPSTPARDHP